MRRLSHNSVSLAVDGDAIEELGNGGVGVAIDIGKGLLVVDDDGLAVEVEDAGREDVRGERHELDASGEDLAIGSDGGAEEKVDERDVNAIAGDGGSGISTSNVVGEGEGEVGKDSCRSGNGRDSGDEAESDGGEGLHVDDVGVGWWFGGWWLVEWIEEEVK